MGGTVDWFDAWWLTAVHMLIMTVLLPWNMSIILPGEIFVGLIIPAALEIAKYLNYFGILQYQY